MDKVYFPKSKVEILDIFSVHNIPESYFNPRIEIITYSENEYTNQKILHIKYDKNAKTLQGTVESKVFIIDRGLESEYNVESPSPESEFLYTTSKY